MSRHLVAPLTLLVSLTGCGSSDSKKPALEACADCKYIPPGTTIGTGGGGGAAGAAGTAGAAGAAGTAGAGGQIAVGLSGEVGAITDGDLATSAVYGGAVVIAAKALDGSEKTVKATTEYTLSGVASGPQWISTKPVSVDALGTLLFATVPPMDAKLDLLVVRTEALTTVLGTLPKPTALAAQGAHAVVYFRSPEGLALSAVKLTPTFTADVGHDDGPGYGGVETHGRGIAVVFNAKAAPAAMATIEHAGSKATITLPLASDQVTMVTVTLKL